MDVALPLMPWDLSALDGVLMRDSGVWRSRPPVSMRPRAKGADPHLTRCFCRYVSAPRAAPPPTRVWVNRYHQTKSPQGLGDDAQAPSHLFPPSRARYTGETIRDAQLPDAGAGTPPPREAGAVRRRRKAADVFATR